MSCIFCDIATGKATTTFDYEDGQLVVFDDLYPKAPIHKLIVPKQHIATLNDIVIAQKDLAGHLLFTAQLIARQLKVAADGYRVMMNCNRDGGQEIFHLHMHFLAGKRLPFT